MLNEALVLTGSPDSLIMLLILMPIVPTVLLVLYKRMRANDKDLNHIQHLEYLEAERQRLLLENKRSRTSSQQKSRKGV